MEKKLTYILLITGIHLLLFLALLGYFFSNFEIVDEDLVLNGQSALVIRF